MGVADTAGIVVVVDGGGLRPLEGACQPRCRKPDPRVAVADGKAEGGPKYGPTIAHALRGTESARSEIMTKT